MVLKFRAWDKLGKEMHKVSVIDFSSKGARIIRLAGVQSNGKGDHKRLHSSVELMQSTGFKDVNGVEIYEGDIVQDSYSGEVSFIEFQEGAFYITCSNVTELISENDDIIEIIGNIFENEELLEAMR
ncbi:TPA: YopX family protein [Staphylococcus aureus]|nr:YopX family protein [Staphylococcus aureus]MBU7904987.1 YopX family protein [Staphylococcus aureus]MBU7913005.1 YopX family protein [Staphylococcus aureus]MBU8243546.1 YopX family protein [Staphylococcus aureus]MBU8254292.1 YopX family protein [Staphylococcus aureus]